ncbi:MAG TPA: NAD(P)H-dependent oxidoreductase [Noviherbaspirillum sp.]|jgi:glutathione-regulated potassium-efflux system ancillary protein KefF|uniref:glutathione-regulated potassium-efflux system oxidoreductase KefF n=1 Tax=Noviherbaspirillum sp. TaxID=1926288 RepID=UPI002DDCF89F|nr:NAD(P)H-dependent oxidoreductase [Noviherbaspirillum sp.]HEV2611283.1 NAD(P)H-dependent oxidoreductase [Noviherbaspirillum sp.]
MTEPGPRIVVVYAHPTHRLSRVNRRLIEAAMTVPRVQVSNLYETYPDFYIDVAHEQALLAQADLIVFQHPIQWYSMPSLMKEWIDLVLEYGWAYGRGGNALQGKDCWLVATTGSREDSYRAGGVHGHAFDAFLPPFRQTAALCGMRWLPPLILHGAHKVDDPVIDAHIETYRNRLVSYPDIEPD